VVVPIFKKGTSSCAKNYRPISLTCVGSKIFETIIKSTLVPFFEGKNLISTHQHGFRSKHSTCLNLLEALNDWTENLDSQIDTYVAHVDFARAFDSVPIPKLIHKLKGAGVSGALLACIEALLTNRTQRVRIENSLSSALLVCSGVPQGSVLGPILFIFYINDLVGEISPLCVPKLFADDLKAYNRGQTADAGKAFSETLENIARWSKTWQLPVSSEKSKWILISNKSKAKENEDFIFTLAGNDLPNTREVLDLGIIFNTKLHFSAHISTIINKSRQRLFLLRKIFRSGNHRILIQAFKTYIIPLLEHCSQVWNPHNIDDIKRLESIQRLFTKKLPGFQGLCYSDRLHKAGLFTLEKRRLWADLCLCYKILHGLVDTSVDNLFERDIASTTRGHTWKLKAKTPRIDCRLYFFSFRVVNAWNALSSHTVEATSFIAFRKLLRKECLDAFLSIIA
jgi:ribonuclease P/MRP protein subunit RPP40